MTTSPTPVNTVAPIRNVALFADLLNTMTQRPPQLPGFGVFYGRAGLGKSVAASYGINRFRAHYVECDFTWTQKAFCEAVMVELGLLAVNTPLNKPVYKAVQEIGFYLSEHPARPLIIDEADFLVKKKMIEVVRAIYKHCANAGASIILIGEEQMPGELKLWERVDSRVLKFTQAQPLNNEDIKALITITTPELSFHKSAVDRLKSRTHGSARRCVNLLYNLGNKAGVEGWTRITAEMCDQVEGD